MSKNLNDPGRPSEVTRSYRMAEPTPYVAVTRDVHPWMDEAACVGWHPTPGDKGVSDDERRMLEWVDLPARAAKRICGVCPVREACLERTLKLRWLPQFGVWGGLTPQELRERQQPLVDAA